MRQAQLQGALLAEAQLQGADLNQSQLQGADLNEAQLQGADLRRSAIWRVSTNGTRWVLADLRGSTVQPMTDSEVDALVNEATRGIPSVRSFGGVRDMKDREAVAERLNAGLRTAERPPRPHFPEEWRSEPTVMFSAGDPDPEPFNWGSSKLTTERTYDEALAKFLGDLACSRDAPEAQVRGLARRALEAARLQDGEPDRVWPRLFAARVIGADCPPAGAGRPHAPPVRTARSAGRCGGRAIAGAPRALPSSEGSVTSTDHPIWSCRGPSSPGSQPSGLKVHSGLTALAGGTGPRDGCPTINLTAFDEYGPIALGPMVRTLQWRGSGWRDRRRGAGPGYKRLRAKPNEPKRLGSFSILAFSGFSRPCSRGEREALPQEACAGQSGWRSSQSIT